MTVMTIGHSTRSADDFLALLKAHGVTAVADVRAMPRSRRHPHFAGEALAATLAAHGMLYEHFPELGGHRRPRPDSSNRGWRHPSFRGYADYMQSPEFAAGIGRLLELTKKSLASVMCAESQWWRCHRQLIADALVVRGVEVRHIMSPGRAPLHELTSFARIITTPPRPDGEAGSTVQIHVWYPDLLAPEPFGD
jgi:uncharacterized protein (DUF488 family)